MQIKELLIFNGLELLPILSYAVLNVVFLFKKDLKGGFFIRKTKENQNQQSYKSSIELQKLYWATKALLSYKACNI